MATKTKTPKATRVVGKNVHLRLVPTGHGENTASVRVECGDPTQAMVYANAVRRTLIDEIPYVAIDPTSRENTRFDKNSSLFTDEFLRLRLAMIPLSLSRGVVARRGRDEFLFQGDVPVLRLVANHSGSHAHADKVFSDALQPTDGGRTVLPGKAEDGLGVGYDPVSLGYPVIAKLRAKESLAVQCTVQCKRGLDHAAFSPVGAIGYRVDAGGVTLEIESNNAGSPNAVQHLNDALYWAGRYLNDFRRDIGNTPVRIELKDDASNVIVSVKHGTETSASVIIAEVRRLLKGRGMAAYRVPHPLTPQLEFHVSPPQGAVAKNRDALKKWGVGLLRKAAANAIKQFGTMRTQLTKTDPSLDWAPTILDTL